MSFGNSLDYCNILKLVIEAVLFQVNRRLIENDIIPIFAVGERVLEMYKQISDHLTQLSSVGT